jgi:alpha-D-ribose 1-methylphosphonate 5-triphosphate synthase subunit PhnG
MTSTTRDKPDANDATESLREARRRAMAVLAASDTADLARVLDETGGVPAHEDIRAPESGLVMVRGRAGGDGVAFNLGEATVTRAAVRLASGETGFGYVLGRDRAKARLIAVCDALMCSPQRTRVEQVLLPLAARRDETRKRTAERTAATRVEFFTLVRGEG